MKRLATLAALCAVPLPVLAQTPLTATITIKEGTSSKTLTFGLHPQATNGLDATLGEAELPPMPPSGVFEARWVAPGDSVQLGEGSYIDFRQGSGLAGAVRTYKARFQRGAGGTVTVEWRFPSGVTAQAQDDFGGVIVNQAMATPTGSFTVAVPAIENLRFVLTVPVGTAREVEVSPEAFGLAVRSNGQAVPCLLLSRAAHVEAHDALGRRVFAGPAAAGVPVALVGLAPGTYLVRASDEQQAAVVQVVVR